MRRLLALFGGIAVGLVIVASVGATTSVAGGSSRDNATASGPVPSLTPVATGRLWSELVLRPRQRALRSTDCRPLRAVFYAATDWLRLATKLAANASPCAQYYISVPPLVADKTMPRADQAWRIRALGPAFNALAEVNVTAWSSWVATTGNSWYAAGVEARRRLATAGYDIAAGDSWALNELSSAVRQGVGSARVNMRAFLHGLYDGDGALASARGTVFITGISQPTADLSLYQARLQDWYEDAEFWDEISHYVNDWSQELYGDIRNYAVAGQTREARRDSINEYLQHQIVPRERIALDSSVGSSVPYRCLQSARERGLAVRRLLRLDERSRRADAGLRLGADVRECLGGQQPLRLRVVAPQPRRHTLWRLHRPNRRSARSARSRDHRLGTNRRGSVWLDVVQPRSRRRQHDDRLADLRNMEAIRPRLRHAHTISTARHTIRTRNGRTAHHHGNALHGRTPGDGRADDILCRGTVLDQRRRPLDSDTHDNDRLGRDRDQRLLPRLTTRLSNDRGSRSRQDQRHPDDHNRIRRRRQRWGGGVAVEAAARRCLI